MFPSYSCWLFLERQPARRVFPRRAAAEDDLSAIASALKILTFADTAQREQGGGRFPPSSELTRRMAARAPEPPGDSAPF